LTHSPGNCDARPANIMFRLLDTLNVPPLDASLRSTASRSRFGIIKKRIARVVRLAEAGGSDPSTGKCNCLGGNSSLQWTPTNPAAPVPVGRVTDDRPHTRNSPRSWWLRLNRQAVLSREGLVAVLRLGFTAIQKIKQPR